MRTLADRILAVLSETNCDLVYRQVWARIGYLGAASSVRLVLNHLEKEGRVKAYRNGHVTLWSAVR